ncbi:D,D-heptose 1,7-bisphosphate phosphatase [Burkholderia sp. WAC0059]|uniref:D-glycero-alpha-D-manno-heptose-1,7-bisphosphate 7-phosphatase n=1 Tax=Burkholderia sp. WAC0059 TaxID=2066022 RepID=UPI000C7EE80F|nr:HAD family hydrolase [Burkholderia sp. WAC0059]PLZ00555.1 D,D-heptose 1,7-bisphosphate phosphatase [Burkholderia sp. WAC0059]
MRALFLDRDGVINVDTGYVHRKDEFEFIPGILELAAWANQCQYKVFIVTNQAGIGRGFYTERDFSRLMDWVLQKFRDAGGPIEKVYFCPHHPDHGLGEYRQACTCRKPAPGLLLQAILDYGIDPGQSILVGDKKTDMEAGRAAGIGTLLYVGDETDYQPEVRIASPLDTIHYLHPVQK